MKILALAAIVFYRRFLSPWKGFFCAYRVHTGHACCSALGFRAVRRYGVRHGLDVLRGRFERCGDAHRKYRVANRFREAGHCDIPDVSCDHGDWDCLSSVCDAASCFDLPCNSGVWWGQKRKAQKDKNASTDAQQNRNRGGEISTGNTTFGRFAGGASNLAALAAVSASNCERIGTRIGSHPLAGTDAMAFFFG